MSDPNSKSYPSTAIANTVLRTANLKGIKDISPMKLQKLVYYSHAWSLALLDRPLIRDDIQAWEYGPVIPDLYHEFKYLGNKHIKEYAHDIEKNEGELGLTIPFVEDADHKALDIISQVVSGYGHLSPIQLSNLTHRDGEPWKVISDAYHGLLPRNMTIPNWLIKDCFVRLNEEGKHE